MDPSATFANCQIQQREEHPFPHECQTNTSQYAVQEIEKQIHERNQHGWRRVVLNFTPSWFSVNMGTGIVSIQTALQRPLAVLDLGRNLLSQRCPFHRLLDDLDTPISHVQKPFWAHDSAPHPIALCWNISNGPDYYHQHVRLRVCTCLGSLGSDPSMDALVD